MCCWVRESDHRILALAKVARGALEVSEVRDISNVSGEKPAAQRSQVLGTIIMGGVP